MDNSSFNGWLCLPARTVGQVALRVVTWNVWFDLHRWKDRLKILVQDMEALEPAVDVICFQETTARFARELWKLPWIRQNFLSSLPPETARERYGVMILVRACLFSHLLRFPLESDQQRHLLVAVPQPFSSLVFSLFLLCRWCTEFLTSDPLSL